MPEKKDPEGLFRLNLGQIRAELKDMELNDCRALIVLMATEIEVLRDKAGIPEGIWMKEVEGARPPKTKIGDDSLDLPSNPLFESDYVTAKCSICGRPTLCEKEWIESHTTPVVCEECASGKAPGSDKGDLGTLTQLFQELRAYRTEGGETPPRAGDLF